MTRYRICFYSFLLIIPGLFFCLIHGCNNGGHCTDGDKDGYYYNCYPIDCDDLDPDNWESCLTCEDADDDGYLSGCDAYSEIPGPDCHDGESSINPGNTFDPCDGKDEDCDGNDCITWQAVGDTILVVNNALIEGGHGPSLAWTGSEFAVVWSDTRDDVSCSYGTTAYDCEGEIYFARMGNQGIITGGGIRVTHDPADSIAPSIEWTGSEFGLVWQDLRSDGDGQCDRNSGTMDCCYQIYFSRLSAEGSTIGGNVRLNHAPDVHQLPDLVWTGTEFGVLWNSGYWRGYCTEVIFFSRLSAAGMVIGSEKEIFPLQGSGCIFFESDLNWTGKEFSFSYDLSSVQDKLNLVTFNSFGDSVTEVTIMQDIGWCEGSQPAWTGSEYGIAFGDFRYDLDGNIDETVGSKDYNCEISFIRATGNGDTIGQDIRIIFDPETSYVSKIVWNGNGYGLVYVTWPPSTISLINLSLAGQNAGSAAVITDRPGFNFSSSLVWTGSEYGVAWCESDNNVYWKYCNRVMFARMERVEIP